MGCSRQVDEVPFWNAIVGFLGRWEGLTAWLPLRTFEVRVVDEGSLKIELGGRRGL